MDQEQAKPEAQEGTIKVEKSPENIGKLINELQARNEDFGGLLSKIIFRENGQRLLMLNNTGNRNLPGYGVDEKSKSLVVIEQRLAERFSAEDAGTVEQSIKSLNPDLGTNIGAYMTDMSDDSGFIKPVIEDRSYENWLTAYRRAENIASTEHAKQQYVKMALEEVSKSQQGQAQTSTPPGPGGANS